MNLTKYGFSDFRVFVVFILVAVSGYALIPRLNVQLHPSEGTAEIYISYSFKGASPETVDKKAGALLEEKIAMVEGIKSIRTYAYSGFGYIVVTLDRYTDPDQARLEIATAVRQLADRLPEAVSYPQISLRNPEEQDRSAFLVYQVYADRDTYDIYRWLERQLLPELHALPQLDRVKVQGFHPREYLILFDHRLMELYGISSRQIIEAIRKYTRQESLGKTVISGRTVSVILDKGQPEDWKIPVKRHQGRTVYLTDIASVKVRPQPPSAYHRVNGKTSLILSLYPLRSANTLVLRNQVEEIIENALQQWPSGIQIVKTYDSTRFVRDELRKIFIRTLAVLSILFLFVWAITRNTGYFLTVLFSLSIALGWAFLLYYMSGIRIELYSLAGITISFGLMIDNIIVVSDHLKNQNRSSVFLPVLAATLTTIAALSVIFLLDEKLQTKLRDFALVIIFNLITSVITALFFTPVLLGRFGLIGAKHERKPGLFYRFYERFLNFSFRLRPLFIVLVVLLFGIPLFMLPEHIESPHPLASLYNKTLGSDWYREKIKPYADKYLGGSLRLFSYYVYEGAVYRENTETKLYVTGRMPLGSNLEQFNEVFLSIDNYLAQIPGIHVFKTDVYDSGYGQTEIIFDKGKENLAYSVKSRLIQKALDWGGISWNIYGVGKGFDNQTYAGSNYNFLIEAKGYNPAHLNRWIDTLKIRLLSHPRINEIAITTFRYPTYRHEQFLRLRLKPEVLSILNITPGEILKQIRLRTPNKAPSFRTYWNGKYTQFRLQERQASGFDIWHLQHDLLTPEKRPVKLAYFSTIDTLNQPPVIFKQNQEYYKYVHVQYTGASKFGKKVIRQKLDSLSRILPVGITFKLSDRYFLFSGEENRYASLILFVILMIWGISLIFFENFRYALIVISMVPVSFIGIFLIFYLFDFPFDQGGIAGFVLVSGLTVNAVYYIMYEYLSLRKQNPRTRISSVYLQAYRHKIFPVSLTLISTVLGFLPFVWSGPQEVFWFSLGIATIGGLLFSFVGLWLYLPLFLWKKNA